MADLISRAAAIDAIECLRGGCITDDVKNFTTFQVLSVSAVDAVPVEWLREKMRGYASALKSTETAALVRVMQMWEDEQEAR